MPARERLTVACHECGHALVGAAVAAQIEELTQQKDTADGWLTIALERAQTQQVCSAVERGFDPGLLL